MDSVSEIIEACKKGDRKGQEMLYRQISPKLFGVCLRYAGSREEAEDLLQDSFMRIFEKINSYRAEGNFEGWARKLTVNICLEELRKKNVLFRHDDITDLQYKVSEENLMSEINAKELINALQELPQGYRTVFNLYEIEGYSHDEIASKLEISSGTSKSQLARAKQALRDKINRMHLIAKPMSEKI